MTFKIGDRVRFNPAALTSATPEWYQKTGEIVALDESVAQGDCLLAEVRMDDGAIQQGIRTTMLILAWDGPHGLQDRNDPVAEACPHCDGDAKLLPPQGDRSDYRCPTCGYFSVDGTTERLFEIGFKDPTTAQFVMQNGRRWLRLL